MAPSKTVYSLVAVAFVFFQILFAIHSQISLRTIVASGNRWHAAPDEEVTAAMDAVVASQTDGLLNDVRTLWSDSLTFPQTKLVRHAPGFTILDNLYALNGTIYIVTDKPRLFPELRMMTSTGAKIETGPDTTEPTEKDLRIITVKQAKELFGQQAGSVSGVSFMNSDDPQYITHYYHFAAELLFGLWRAYTSLDADIQSNGATILPPPSRLIFTHTSHEHWRDYAAMNQWIFHAAFPSAALEFKGDWEDRGNMDMGWVYDRVVLADRAAVTRSKAWHETWRYASPAFELPGRSGPGEESGRDGETYKGKEKDLGAGWWWTPVRKNVLKFAAAKRKGGMMVRKALDFMYSRRDEAQTKDKPVVTYVSRQGWGRRMLKQEDHEVLVNELKRLEQEEGYELNIVHMEEMTREEQLALAGKTDILMGVHGNGLTALLWMEPKPYSTVMEFFCPGGFARDYEWTANRLGMTHYGFWGNTSFTAPNLPPREYPPCFQNNDIPLDGKLVANLVKERLDSRTQTTPRT